MTAIVIDLRRPTQTPNSLSGLRGVLTQGLTGEPFLFARMTYGDELTLHFGTPCEYTLPRFGKRTKGSHILSVRGSAWLVKSGAKPLAAADGLVPSDLPASFGKALTKEDLEAGLLIERDARVVEPIPFRTTGGYGLQVLLSDGSRLTVLPTVPEPDNPGDEMLPELADWELLTPEGALKAGPELKWKYDPHSAAPPG